MKVYEFEAKIASKNGGKVNLIYATSKGYYNVTISDRSHRQDVKNGKVIFYKTVESVKRNSGSHAKSFPTYVVRMNGTDYANAKVTEA
jgi:hypothetical protein